MTFSVLRPLSDPLTDAKTCHIEKPFNRKKEMEEISGSATVFMHRISDTGDLHKIYVKSLDTERRQQAKALPSGARVTPPPLHMVIWKRTGRTR